MSIVKNNEQGSLHDLMLLSLIQESELLHEVFRSKDEYKKAKALGDNIEEGIKNAPNTTTSIQALHHSGIEGIMKAIINSSNVTTTSD